jgi:subtilisin family serine protease
MALDMTLLTRPQLRRKAVWGPKATLAALVIAAIGLAPGASAQERRLGLPGPKAKPAAPSSRVRHHKVDAETTRRMNGNPAQKTSVVVTLQRGAQLPPQFRRYATSDHLSIINGIVLDLPNGILKQLVALPEIFSVHYNRPTSGFNYRTSVTVGATTVRATMGLDGAGIGVAVIDSGIASWHNDLSGSTDSVLHPYGNQRIRTFVDFVSGRTAPYDDNGHGTHVSGIVAGNGYDSNGSKAGIAPGASIKSLKVLNANGVGTNGSMI